MRAAILEERCFWRCVLVIFLSCPSNWRVLARSRSRAVACPFYTASARLSSSCVRLVLRSRVIAPHPNAICGSLQTRARFWSGGTGLWVDPALRVGCAERRPGWLQRATVKSPMSRCRTAERLSGQALWWAQLTLPAPGCSTRTFGGFGVCCSLLDLPLPAKTKSLLWGGGIPRRPGIHQQAA